MGILMSRGLSEPAVPKARRRSRSRTRTVVWLVLIGVAVLGVIFLARRSNPLPASPVDLSISRDGKVAAALVGGLSLGMSGGEKASVVLLDPASREVTKSFDVDPSNTAIELDPTGQYLVALGETASVYEVRSGKLLDSIDLTGDTAAAAFTEDGKNLVLLDTYLEDAESGGQFVTNTQGKVLIAETTTGSIIHSVQAQGGPTSVIVEGDSAYVAQRLSDVSVATNPDTLEYEYDVTGLGGQIGQLKVSSATLVQTTTIPDSVTTAEFGLDLVRSSRMAVGDFWIVDGEQLIELKQDGAGSPLGPTRTAVGSGSGKWIAYVDSESEDSQIVIVDTESGASRPLGNEPLGIVYALEFDAAEQQLIVANDVDGLTPRLTFLDLQSGATIGTVGG